MEKKAFLSSLVEYALEMVYISEIYSRQFLIRRKMGLLQNTYSAGKRRIWRHTGKTRLVSLRKPG